MTEQLMTFKYHHKDGQRFISVDCKTHGHVTSVQETRDAKIAKRVHLVQAHAEVIV